MSEPTKFYLFKRSTGANGGATTASDAEKAKVAELERVIGQQAVEIQVLTKSLKLR